MNLRDLNNQYFELYGDLYQARALLSDKQYKLTSDALLSAYKDDLEVCIEEKALAVGRERYELKFKVRNWLPRKKFLFFNNRIARTLLKRYLADFTAELARLQKETGALSAPAESAEEASNLPVAQHKDLEKQ